MKALRRRGVGVGGAVLSALLLFAAGEPLGLGPLAWVAFVPLLFVVCRQRRWLWAWLYGLIFGVAYFGIHLSWIFLFGWMAWTALVLTMAVYMSVATLLSGVLRRFPFAPALVAGAWAGIELVRDRWPYGGYPWGTTGTTQGNVPGVRFMAGAIGVYGLTFLIVFVCALIADRYIAGRWSWGSIAVVTAALALFVGVDVVRYGPPPPGDPVEMLVVQGGVPRPVRPAQRDAIFDSHVAMTRRAFKASSPDVVIWPEDSIGVGVRDSAMQEVSALARELETPFIVGRSLVRDESFLVTAEHVTSKGKSVAAYTKRHPVPFGEYVPIAFFRRFVSTLNSEIPYDLAPGLKARLFDVEGLILATPICFESVFPRDILDFTRKGAELYVVSTNNASFEHSYASQQHIAHARMRALEVRQWVVQAALAGISGVMTPDGRIEQTTELFDATSFVASVRARPPYSLYARVGDLFPAAFAAGTLLALLLWGYTVTRGRRWDTDAS